MYSTNLNLNLIMENVSLGAASGVSSTGSSSAGLYDSVLKDIAVIEDVLLPQIKELSEKIDSSFKEVSTSIMECADVLIDSKMFNAKNNAKIAIGAAVASTIVDSIGAGYSAYKHNRKLDEILEMKKKIAESKSGAIERILPLSEKTFANATAIVAQNIDRIYPENVIVNDSTRLPLMENSRKEINILRTACYYHLMMKFLDAEYKAWMEGKHLSQMDRPSLYTANTLLFKNVVCAKCYKDDFAKMFNNRNNELTGRELYILSDDMLAATFVIYYGNEYKFVDASEQCLYFPPELTINRENKTKVLDMIYGSKVFRNNLSDHRKVEIFLQKSKGTFWWHVLFLLLFSSVIAAFFMLDWALWLRIVLGIFLEYKIVKKWIDVIETCEFQYYSEFESLRKGMYDRMMKISGYVPYNRDAYNKKSIVGEAIDSIF